MQIVLDRLLLFFGQVALRPGNHQDIAVLGSKLYFHPSAAFGLYEHDLITKSTRELVPYGSGDYIAADSIFVFYDFSHKFVRRYNLSTDTTDLEFPLSSDVELYGLGVYEHSVFVYINEFPGGCFLKKYSLDGMLLDSIPYTSAYSYVTIVDSIAYSMNYYTQPRSCEITRFDMRSRKYLSSLLSPVRLCGGIKVYEGNLYFCSSFKEFIGAVPFSALREKSP